ncbi:hypothetical protein HNQ88_000109 [Aureibacter tunicatorum]|uniref:Uncharacterized protein n=1 Tax=Aureibacter tunicatorum TaxID=866807 RepID=A0AAE4BQN7_9BACT|nr:hypothetical protein [Aureibacter tunicatorum]BDD06125.1 hypothetical protein AUTU_36080 [Aureibacter tunicatorum]
MACIGKTGIPIYFEILDNISGNSNKDDRITLLKQLIDLIITIDCIVPFSLFKKLEKIRSSTLFALEAASVFSIIMKKLS